VGWLRRREPGGVYLALALGLFGLIILLGQVRKLMGNAYPAALSILTTAAFMGCGYALLLFRHHLIPVRRWVLVATGALAAAISLWAFTFPQTSSNSSTSKISPIELVFVVVFLLFWCGLVAEPALTLWGVSRRRPAVQR